MIRLKHTNDLQKFAITLNEFTTVNAPYFLFQFKHLITGEVQELFLNDISQFKQRYNLFEINGDFFASSGWYNYKVYEYMSGTASPDYLIGLLEEGRLYVEPISEEQFTENITQTTHKEYVG